MFDEIANGLSKHKLVPFFGAGVSASHLDVLWQDVSNEMADAMQRVENRAIMVGVLRGMREALENASTVAGPAARALIRNWGNALDEILPMVGSIAGKVGLMLGDAFANPNLITAVEEFFSSLDKNVTKLEKLFIDLGLPVDDV